ncbi:carbohydrate ABC transporter permease [Terrarubrum flagellatum]|uniref:carbohydrate ABC transporter permease n=1 Tax=Terrirubrum flagellatum TaxID=2895980 RepID=UPI003144DC18
MANSSAPRLATALGKIFAVTVILIWSIGPIALIFVASLTHERDIFAAARTAWRPTFENFIMLWRKWGDFFAGLTNSLIIAAGATLLAVAVSTLAGFGYSRWRSRFLSGSAFALIALRLLPPIVTTLPLFPVVNALRLNDTHAVLIILYAAFFVSLGTMVMRTFIDQIPRELDEAAAMDGATQFQILRKVILPLCGQGMVAVAIFVIVFAWNEFLFAFIFTTKWAKTAPLVMSEMIGSLDGVEWGVLFAATITQLLPVLLFVILSQRHLIEGLTAGATKG